MCCFAFLFMCYSFESSVSQTMMKTMTDWICWVSTADVGYFWAIYGNCVFCQEYFHGFVIVLVIQLLAWETVHDGIQKTANSFQRNSHHMLSSLCGSLFYLTNKGIQPSKMCMRQIFNNNTQPYIEYYLCTFDSFQFLNSKQTRLCAFFFSAF